MEPYQKVSYDCISLISSKHKMSEDALDLHYFFDSIYAYENEDFFNKEYESPRFKEEQVLCYSYCKEMHDIMSHLTTVSLEDTIKACRTHRDQYQLHYDAICVKYDKAMLIWPFRHTIIFNGTDIYVKGGESTLNESYTHERIEYMSY
jgi:hypothetical protein